MQDESLAVRNSALITYRSLGGKEDINKIWPLEIKEKNVFKEPDADWWCKVTERQKVIDKQIADARLKNRDIG